MSVSRDTREVTAVLCLKTERTPGARHLKYISTTRLQAAISLNPADIFEPKQPIDMQ